MKKHRRKILVGVVTCLIFLFLVGSTVFAENSGLNKIVDWLQTKPYVVWQDYGGIEKIIYSESKEINISGFDYKWRWDEHYVALVALRDKETEKIVVGGIWFDLQECQELVTPKTHQQIHWNLGDYERDGTIDRVSRFYRIYHEDTGYVAFRLPDGLINSDWYAPSLSVAQKIYEMEVEFWLNQIENENA